MTVAELITNLLESIRSKFYAGKPREFMRDQRGLSWAVASWGRACAERGWEFEPGFVHKEIMAILLDIQSMDRDVEYLPVYLKGAISRRIGQRAEELSAESKRIEARVAKAMNKVQPGEVRQPTTNEMLIALGSDLRRIKRERAQERKAGTKAKQGELL